MKFAHTAKYIRRPPLRYTLFYTYPFFPFPLQSTLEFLFSKGIECTFILLLCYTRLLFLSCK